MPLRFPKASMQLLYYTTYIPTILHNSELVLCTSKATAKEVKNLFKIPSKKLEHIPLAIDHKVFILSN